MSRTVDTLEGLEAVRTEAHEAQQERSAWEEFEKLTKEFVSLPFEPVVGGRPANVSFKLFVLGIMGLAIFSLVNASQTWGVPVTQVALSWESEMTYPDVYLCMPASYVEAFKTTKELYVASGMSSDPSVAATIRTACTEEGLNGVGASGFIKMDPTKQSSDDAYFAGSKTSTPPYKDACVYGTASVSGVTAGRAHFGVVKGEVEDADGIDNVDATLRVSPYDSSDTTGKFNKKVKKLTDALQATKGTDSAMCALFPAGGGTEDSKTQKHSENGRYSMAMQFIQTPTENSFPFFEAYMAEPGVDPVDSKGEVNASKVSFAGFGVVSIALLEMRQLKDETKGDDAFKTYYLSSMWNKPKLSDHAEPGYARVETNQAEVGFMFTSFVVQKITIRNKTFGEIYAEIGGIWAASFALLALIFAKSGARDKKGKEAYIFKFYLPSAKKQAVEAFAAANETAKS